MAIKVNENEIPGTAIEAKQWWRSEISRRSADCDPVYRYIASARIRQEILHSEQYRKAATVMMYFSVGIEVETHDLIRVATAQGKKVCLPVCLNPPEDGTIQCSVIFL